MPWNIDTSHSQVEFTVRHMMISKVRGRFESFEGTVHLNSDNPQLSFVEGTVDINSINTKEAQRDAHLRSADFFDVEKYPKMKFRSTRIEALGKSLYKVYGKLTIKDVTKEVVFDVTDEGTAQDPWGNQRRGVSATTKINRKDYGLNWNVALEAGGWLVGDEITIATEVQLVYEPEAEKEAAAA